MKSIRRRLRRRGEDSHQPPVRQPRRPAVSPREERAETFPFLRLPQEIRELIYCEILKNDVHSEIWIKYSIHRGIWWNATRYCTCHGEMTRCFERYHLLSPAILYTCKMVYEEAFPVLFSNNKIWIDAPPNKALEFLSRLPIRAVHRISYLKLWLDVGLTIGSGPGVYESESPDFNERLRVIRRELLFPWQNLFRFLSENMPSLEMLCIWLPRGCHWHPSITYIYEEWGDFYRSGWMEQLRDTIPQVRTLFLEAQLGDLRGPTAEVLKSLEGMRVQLQRSSGFVERSVEWTHYISYSNGPDCDLWPAVQLFLTLQRQPTLPDDDDPLLRSVTQDCSNGISGQLRPIPQFEQKYSPAEILHLELRNMSTRRPARSPDHYR